MRMQDGLCLTARGVVDVTAVAKYTPADLPDLHEDLADVRAQIARAGTGNVVDQNAVAERVGWLRAVECELGWLIDDLERQTRERALAGALPGAGVV